MDFQSLILTIITALVGVLFTWITPYIVKWLDSKFDHNVIAALQNVAYAAVQAAEQKYGAGSNFDKKAYVEAALKSFATDKKYSVSASDVETLIEAAVYQLKQFHFGGVATLSTDGTGTATQIPAVPVVNVPVTVETPIPDPAPVVPPTVTDITNS